MKFKTKGFTSLLLTCSFSVAAFSGIILYVTPRGRVANWTGWTMLGLDKHSWGALHINACLLFLLVAAVHLFLNWRVFWSYIKKRSTAGVNLKVEMAVALLATAALVAGTLWQVPPLTAPVTLNERIKNYWEQDSQQGPAPHAEEFTVARFASTIGLTTDDVVNSLRQAGYVVEDTEATIGTLAAENDIAPNQVFAAVRKTHPDVAAAMPGNGQGMGRGMGRGMGQGGGGCAGSQSEAQSPSGCGDAGESASCESGGCDPAASQSSADHGPGMGHGQGGGMGRGQGGGMGRGQGGGMGPGWMRGGGEGMGPGWQHDEGGGNGHEDTEGQPATKDGDGDAPSAGSPVASR